MKIKSVVTDLSHDELVNLFSTATYGNNWLSAYYDKDKYNGLFAVNECFEDKLASILLKGGTIEFIDGNAEDENDKYGNVNKAAYWDNENDCMCYPVTLQDITDGLGRASESDYGRKCLNEFADENGDFDICIAENLVQYIIFGELVYG